jgi:beta-phosphoglucomutase-like phosphatase (HAD superfamily)
LIERWPEAVIFDMDGLMLDTEGPARAPWVASSISSSAGR